MVRRTLDKERLCHLTLKDMGQGLWVRGELKLKLLKLKVGLRSGWEVTAGAVTTATTPSRGWATDPKVSGPFRLYGGIGKDWGGTAIDGG